MHLKGIPAGWQGSSAHVRVKHTYGLTLRSVIQIEALRDCRCCKNVHFYISCCMERLWSCGWKGWGTGSFEALGNAVLACLVMRSHSYVWQRTLISALKVKPHENRHHKRKKKQKKAARYCWAVWWRAYALNLWSSEVCANENMDVHAVSLYRSRSFMSRKHNLPSHMALTLSENYVKQMHILNLFSFLNAIKN